MSRILIVDDEQDIVELISYNLEKEGFSCVKAYDGETALKLAKTKKPELIILDLMLPKINGLDVCRAIRHDPVHFLEDRITGLFRKVGKAGDATHRLFRNFCWAKVSL